MLHSLHPNLALHQQTLLLAVNTHAPRALALAGRGLELRPNLFIEGVIGGTLNDRYRPTVFYPANGAGDARPDTRDPLVVLVGKGRARALRAIGDGATTTTDLAQRLGVTAPTASEHAAALRNAGLITTRRSGKKVHQLTMIGDRRQPGGGQPDWRQQRVTSSGPEVPYRRRFGAFQEVLFGVRLRVAGRGHSAPAHKEA